MSKKVIWLVMIFLIVAVLLQVGCIAKTWLCIWGSSPSDVFAVGTDGTILHYDGNSWNSMTSGTGEYLRV